MARWHHPTARSGLVWGVVLLLCLLASGLTLYSLYSSPAPALDRHTTAALQDGTAGSLLITLISTSKHPPSAAPGRHDMAAPSWQRRLAQPPIDAAEVFPSEARRTAGLEVLVTNGDERQLEEDEVKAPEYVQPPAAEPEPGRFATGDSTANSAAPPPQPTQLHGAALVAAIDAAVRPWRQGAEAAEAS